MRRLPIYLCFAWLLAVSAGMAVILSEEKAAGRAGHSGKWPVDAGFAPDTNRDTLIMFVHPQCPCTRASVEELNRLLAESRGSVATRVVFFKPTNFPDDWTRSDLWKTVEAIPGVVTQADPDNALAKKFGAETSGYVVLYNPRGELLFSGGITSGRGHVGDNAGESALAALLAGRYTAVKQTPVYGCSLSGCTPNLRQ